jgi:hypothetical protein
MTGRALKGSQLCDKNVEGQSRKGDAFETFLAGYGRRSNGAHTVLTQRTNLDDVSE